MYLVGYPSGTEIGIIWLLLGGQVIGIDGMEYAGQRRPGLPRERYRIYAPS